MSEIEARAKQFDEGIIKKESRYLFWALSNKGYGPEMTAVPRPPVYFKDVTTLMDQVIPTAGLRARFGMETTDITEQTCIVFVEFIRDDHNFSTGIVVECIPEVLGMAGEDIEEAPQFGSTISNDFILGMVRIGESLKITSEHRQDISK